MTKVGHPTALRVRNDARIGNVEALKSKAPELVEAFGPRTSMGELKSGLLARVLALPKAQRAVFLAQLGGGNQAAQASMGATMLADTIAKSDAYYVQIGGKKLDRALLEAFLGSGVVSADDAEKRVVPRMIDGGRLTPAEADTYLFAMKHFKATDKAVREQLVPALREATGAPVKQLANGEQGFDFVELYDHLDKYGRLQDLYSAKTDMTDDEMLAMWSNGISLADLNAHLEASLAPKPAAALEKELGKTELEGVVKWLSKKGDKATLQRIAHGKVSSGEMQNLIYGSWEHANTPYDPNYRAKLVPFPVVGKPTLERKIENAIAAHDWKTLLGYFDPENRETQRKLGVTSDAQYIAEGLGLHMAGNSLPGDITKLTTLDQLERVSLGARTATLKDGTVLAIDVPIKDGKISPAVG